MYYSPDIPIVYVRGSRIWSIHLICAVLINPFRTVRIVLGAIRRDSGVHMERVAEWAAAQGAGQMGAPQGVEENFVLTLCKSVAQNFQTESREAHVNIS